MAKAFLVTSDVNNPLASGDEYNLFGYGGDSATEANTQASATEAMTFSGLGFRVLSGGSGTNTLRFRDAGADGQQTVSIAGTGSIEDTTNSDVLSAGDLFNIAYTDDGTDSTCGWHKMNVEFASGYGSFHGGASFAGVVHDVASSTRFIGLGGPLLTDAGTNEAIMGFKVRGYTTFEALQVRITANARVNDSIFKNRINNADGTGSITFTSGATGLLTATGLADAITAGQVVNASLTLDTGVQDLTVAFVVGTFKSTTNKCEVWCASVGGILRTASATASYHCLGGTIRNFTSLTEANARTKPGFAGTASNLRCYLAANTYTGDGTLKLMQNGVAVLTTTITASGGAGWYENTADSVTFDDNDEFSFEIDEGTSGDITVHMIGITFAQAAAAGDVAAGRRLTLLGVC